MRYPTWVILSFSLFTIGCQSDFQNPEGTANSENNRTSEPASATSLKAQQGSEIPPTTSTKVGSLEGTKYQAGKTFGIEFATSDCAIPRGKTFPSEVIYKVNL